MKSPRAKDLVGRLVRLTDDVELRSGKRYPKGSEWVITGTWRGAFSLEGAHALGMAPHRALSLPARSLRAHRRLRSIPRKASFERALTPRRSVRRCRTMDPARAPLIPVSM